MGNTVGSLTKKQQSVIIGTLLGDGHIRRISGRSDAFLEINHSWRAKEYVDWKYAVLKNIVTSPPKKRVSGENKFAYRFFTQQHKDITKLYKSFYVNNRKAIPKNLKFDPIMLAVWFMDDGSKSRRHDVYLNTQQFSMRDQKRLLYCLREVGINARLNKDKKYYRIRLLKESVSKFNSIVEPYIIPSMRYKLSYDPVETCPQHC